MPFNNCRRQYFNNKCSTLPLLDLVEGVVDTEAQTITLFFPYPFLLLGFGNRIDYVSSPPVSELPMAFSWEIQDQTLQVANVDLIQNIFIVMMYANRDVGNYPASPFLGSISYLEKAFAKFNNYFNAFLTIPLKDYFYNQFLSTANIINKFWEDQAADGNPTSDYPNLLKLCERLFNTSDRRLWGAPGVYTIYYGDNVPEGEFIEPVLSYGAYSS